jgi:hypothetical protein
MTKNLKIFLTISVLANVLLAGALGGMVMDQRKDMPWEKMKARLEPGIAGAGDQDVPG